MTPRRATSARPALLAAPALAGLTLLLAACGGGAEPTGTGTDPATEPAASGLDCSNATTAGWELMLDPRLTVTPAGDVLSLQSAGEAITFTDTDAGDQYTTHSWSLGYIDSNGTVFQNSAAIFIDGHEFDAATGATTFTLEGPLAPSGVDGGPYAGIVQIEATDGAGTTTLGRICVALAQ